MPLPPQETFTLEEVAQKFGRSVHYVEEQVCARAFKYIIVKGEVIGGLPLTRHLYFDQDLWIKDYGEKVMLDPASQEKEYEERVKLEQAYREKQLEKAGKLYRADLEKKYGAKHGAKLEREYREWEKQHGGKVTFDPTTLRKQYENKCKTFYFIGPNEVANLSLAKQWEWPKEDVVIYIPRATLETFQAEHPESSANPRTKETNEKWSWRTIAREIGQRLAREHGNKRLSLDQLAKKVYEEMKKRHANGGPGLTGRSGRIPDPATILRHALQKIRS